MGPNAVPPAPAPQRPDASLTPVCAIGASAGGLKALQRFFSRVDPELGLAYVVIVHLAPGFPSHLGEVLGSGTDMPVCQVDDRARLEPNRIYVVAPDRELVIRGDDIEARPFTEPRGRRAPIDMFFRSVAAGRGDGLVAVLSGAGSDGAVGVREVKEAGGVVLVQDPGEADYAAMPRAAISTGAADFVAPVETIGERVEEIVRSRGAVHGLRHQEAVDELADILRFLRARTGHDFSGYKRATILRRVLRRLQVTRCESLAAYARHLRETPEEGQALFDDLLISVTMFFRDQAAFETLAREAIGPMMETNASEEPIRVWVAGCATGEEAYSLAILLIEEAERRQLNPAIQIFATDLDDGSLATAREGRYPAAIEVDVSEERLMRFFVNEGGHYRIRDEVRDCVLFAQHSVLKDPPFMHLDLVCCRNLLIYMDRETQSKLLALFYFALNPSGILFLGSAETADLRPELFTTAHRDARIFVARPRASRGVDLLPELQRGGRTHPPAPPRSELSGAEAEVPRAVHAAALEDHAPPSVLVDEGLRILHMSRNAGRFIQPSEGPLRSELPEIVRPELRSELRAALQRALRAREPILTLPSAVTFDGGRRRVVMYVTPAGNEPPAPAHAMVLFMDSGPLADGEPAENGEVAPDIVRTLREELLATQERLGATRRSYESAIQELRVANEELQSINEEYRSTAEELETSKEELQSVNEELQAVNLELKNKLEAIARAHDDLRNLVDATDIGTLFLDCDLRINMLTPAVEKLFPVSEWDTGRPITDFTSRLAYDGIEADARSVLTDRVPIETEVETNDGRWLMMRLRPYRTGEDRVEGVVVSFVDITERRNMEARLRQSEARYRSLFEAMDEGFLLARVVRDEAGAPVDLFYLEANLAARRILGTDYIGRSLSEITPGSEPYWYEIPARVAETDVSERNELYCAPLKRWFDSGFSRVAEDTVAILFQDVTARRQQEAEREMLVAELNHRVKNMLAVVQSIAMQTLRTNPDPQDFTTAFRYRLHALGRAHALLTENHWRGSDLAKLARAVLEGFVTAGEDRIRLDGPPVQLSSNATISFAMTFHELATNAVKHGALTVSDGVVHISWSVDRDGDDENATFRLTWEERGGPAAERPARHGFGLRIVEQGIAHELRGDVELGFGDTGFVCRMTIPLMTMVRNR